MSSHPLGSSGQGSGSIERYVTAILEADRAAIGTSRRVVVGELGAERAVEVAAVASYFNGLNRVTDATGTRLEQDVDQARPAT